MPRDKGHSLLSRVKHAIEFRSGAPGDQRACLVETCRNACHKNTSGFRPVSNARNLLCMRGGHGIELTPAGRAVPAHCGQLLAYVRAARVA